MLCYALLHAMFAYTGSEIHTDPEAFWHLLYELGALRCVYVCVCVHCPRP